VNQGEKFKRSLAKRQISKMEAAKKLGVDRRAVYQMFETKSFHDNTIDKIENLLGIPREELLSHPKLYQNMDDAENIPRNEAQSVDVALIKLESENKILSVRLEAAEKSLKDMERYMNQLIKEKEQSAERLLAEKDNRISDLSEMLKTLSKKRDSNPEGLGRTKPARLESEVAEE